MHELIRKTDASTWSPRLHELIEAEKVSLIKYELIMDYGYWTYRTYVITELRVSISTDDGRRYHEFYTPGRTAR